jgi:PIN domain nuclease of toxin-antitoxin system
VGGETLVKPAPPTPTTVLLDTHVLIWWIADQSKLSTQAKITIETAAANGKIYISAMTVWEIAMLVKKQRLKLTLDPKTWIQKVLQLPMIECLDLDHRVALRSVLLPNPPTINSTKSAEKSESSHHPAATTNQDQETTKHQDPVDRILVATAQAMDIPLVSMDQRIKQYPGVRVVW